MAAVTVEVSREVDVGRARRLAGQLCAEAGFGPVERGCVTTSVAELARNLLQHAGCGTIALQTEGMLPDLWIEVRAEDDGPGIADLGLALQDGYSTDGGLGSGLPGVRRLMDSFEIASAPGSGTRIVARKRARRG